MLQLLLWFCFAAADVKKYTDQDMLKDVKNTLSECSDIVEAVGDFLSIFEKDERRRASDLGNMVVKKLKTCSNIIEAVNAFRQNHFSPMKRGAIGLELNEARYLNQILKDANMKLGKTLFIATKDGDSSAQFHKLCDGKGATVTIVLSTTNAVFGGYSFHQWGGSARYHSSKTNFLFRLRPAMSKYTVKKGREGNAMYTHPSYGPTFGGGHDLYIANKALSSTSSYTNGGHSYNFPSYPSYQLNDGSKNFKVKEYVVLQAVKL